MFLNKLKKLKRQEDKAALKESKGLYEQITQEYYPKKPKRVWLYLSTAVASVGVLALLAVGGIKGLNFVIGGLNKQQLAVLPAVQTVQISALNGALKSSTFVSEGLKFKSVKLHSSNNKEDYYSVEVDSFHTLDIIVKINPDAVVESEDFSQMSNFKTGTVNGFTVNYTEKRRWQEDYFRFSTRAVVSTGNEQYYIAYDYTSQSPNSELMELIQNYIKPI